MAFAKKPMSGSDQMAGRTPAGAHGDGSAAPVTENSGAGKKRPARRRGRQDRGVETRNRLIEAALDAFGRYGFDGASTRQIAEKADTNIALIKYHFGSKEALHVTVAEHIVAQVSQLVGPMIMKVNSPETFASPKTAREGLIRLIETFADTVLGQKKAEQWARFIVREQMQPTQAFEVINRFIGTAHEVGSRLVATALDLDATSDEVKIRTFTLMGQVLVFRVAQALVLRQLGWQSVGENERAEIKRVIVAHINAILDAEAGEA